MITTTTGTEEVTLTPEQDAVFSDLTITEDNQSYNLHLEAITDNEALDNTEWTIAIIAQRGYGTSTDANAKKTLEFKFAIKNVCRDLPWKVPQSESESITYNAYADQSIKLETGLYLDNDFSSQWVEYCDISYKMLYKAGSLLGNVLYANDISMYTFDSDANAFTGQIKSRDWIGTH
jgi:hypothetical protein